MTVVPVYSAKLDCVHQQARATGASTRSLTDIRLVTPPSL